MIENCEECNKSKRACQVYQTLLIEAFGKKTGPVSSMPGPSGLATSKHATTDVLSTRKTIQQLVEENRTYNFRGKDFEEAVRGIKSEDGKSQLFRKNNDTMVVIMRSLGITSCGCSRLDPESGNLTKCCACYQMGDQDDEDN